MERFELSHRLSQSTPLAGEMRPRKFKVCRRNDSHATAICILVLLYFTRIARPKRRAQGVEKVLKALFRGFALTHWSGHKWPSRPFVRVRKRFCKQNCAKIAAHVADFRFTVCRQRVTMTFFDSLSPPKEAGRCYFVQYSMYAAVLFSTASLSCIQALAMSA